MIKLNDVTKKDITVFNNLEIGDYFMWPREDVIWKKVDRVNAIQITNYENFSTTTTYLFDSDITVTKIKIISIDYKRIK